MALLGGLFRTAVAQKAIMAVTGIILFGFVHVHMAGNLKLYLGAEHYNEYAEFLREAGSPALPHGGMLWISRVVLLVVVTSTSGRHWRSSCSTGARGPRGTRARTRCTRASPRAGCSWAESCSPPSSSTTCCT